MIEITRKVEFDAGHRIPDHNSKCRNAHGHRYVLEATVSGVVKMVPGTSDNGMVQDFGDLKQIMNRAVADKWDHGFLVFEDDGTMRTALRALGEQHNTIVLTVIPTVENLVLIAAAKIEPLLPSGTLLRHVRLYETPNCWADWYPTK